MEIVGVRFIQDTQSVHTGHEFYPVGATAHFYADASTVLVEQGRVTLTDENPPTEEHSETLPTPAPDLHKMTVKQLREYALDSGVPIKSNMLKADLIAALKE